MVKLSTLLDFLQCNFLCIWNTILEFILIYIFIEVRSIKCSFKEPISHIVLRPQVIRTLLWVPILVSSCPTASQGAKSPWHKRDIPLTANTSSSSHKLWAPMTSGFPSPVAPNPLPGPTWASALVLLPRESRWATWSSPIGLGSSQGAAVWGMDRAWTCELGISLWWHRCKTELGEGREEHWAFSICTLALGLANVRGRSALSCQARQWCLVSRLFNYH